MARIIHTADIHLREYGDERWQGLIKVLEKAREEAVDLLVVCGDLFDEEADAEKLRERIREVFSGNGFPVILLPGNHDRQAYRAGLYFGEEVSIITDFSTPLEMSNVLLWGLPFEDINEIKILERLRKISYQLHPHKFNLLLYHGELQDAYFSRSDMGEEGSYRYMPTKLSYFAEAGFDYVLAGHFHTNFRVWPLPGREGFFVYPGSPVAITTREKGPRKIHLLDTKSTPKEIPLDTFHYQEVEAVLDPFNQEINPLDLIQSKIQQFHPSARAILKITGYFDGETWNLTEAEIIEKTKNLASQARVEVQAEFKDLREVLEDPLTQNFLEKLQQREESEERKKLIQRMALQALMEAKL